MARHDLAGIRVIAAAEHGHIAGLARFVMDDGEVVVAAVDVLCGFEDGIGERLGG